MRCAAGHASHAKLRAAARGHDFGSGAPVAGLAPLAKLERLRCSDAAITTALVVVAHSSTPRPQCSRGTTAGISVKYTAEPKGKNEENLERDTRRQAEQALRRDHNNLGLVAQDI